MQYDKQVQVLSNKFQSQIHRLFTNAAEQTWLLTGIRDSYVCFLNSKKESKLYFVTIS